MDKTSPSEWQKIDAIFDDVLDGPESEREKIIRDRCGGDEPLARRIRDLLDAASRGDDSLEDPSFDGMIDELDVDPLSHPIGKRIGKYAITGLIGQGGMGAVYLCEREDKEFRQKVAVKLISPIFTDKANSANFRRERQILAKLNHPSIAALLDGGTTETGTPYLVMEYVEGVSLTQYSQRENPSIRQRIDLFLEVCEAVKFAHQNLIIHRDLKPANILVTREGKPKLLDFGVAKLLNPELLDITTELTVGANILTPNYASPEQLKGENITTASDVYSLGVILYELLTGRLPLNLKSKSLPDILKAITEETPVLPSVAVSTPTDENDASDGRIHTARDPQPLRGDLDTIVLKALTKDPNERYQTVEALASDLRRHLNDLPILARQPSSAYRFAKFVRRNRTSVISACLIFGLLLGLIGVTAWSAYVSRKQARESLRRAYSSDMNLAMQSYENANLSQMNQLIERYESTDFRGWEWNFLYNLAHPKGRLLTIAHPGEVWNVAFSPDSTRLATACNDGFARIYEVPGGRLLAITEKPEKNIWRLEFSPDGRFLATASGDINSNSVKVWNAENGTETLSLKGHEARVRAIGYSPDGKLIATGSRDGTIRIWNAENGTELKKFNIQLDGRPQESQDLQFTPDGKRLIVAHEHGASIWDVSTGRVIETKEHIPSLAVAISPDGSRFALGAVNSSIPIYDSARGGKLSEIVQPNSKINDLAFSPDGKLLATVASDRTVRFFETEKGVEVQNLRVHFADAWGVAFSPDGKFVATSGTDFNTYLFDSAAIVNPPSFRDWSSAGTLWSAISADRTTIATDSFERRKYSTKMLYGVPLGSAKTFMSTDTTDAGSFSPDGTIVATGNRDGTISLRSTENGEEIRRFKAHECGSDTRFCIKSVLFTPDGTRLVSGGNDGKLILSEVGNGLPMREIFSFESQISAASISPDGQKVFAASYDKTAKLFDLETGAIIADLGKQPKLIVSAIFSSDGKTLVTGSGDGVIRFWNPKDAKLLDTLIGNAGFIFALTFTPDGTRLASVSGEGVIRLWDTETRAQVLAIRTNSTRTHFLAFTPDGNTLISHGSHENIRLWDATPNSK